MSDGLNSVIKMENAWQKTSTIFLTSGELWYLNKEKYNFDIIITNKYLINNWELSQAELLFCC